jgi:3'-5' exoribonuclease
VELLDIQGLKKAAAGRVEAAVHGQVEALVEKTTQSQKPYFELTLADATAKLTLRAWNDSAAFAQCAALEVGAFIEARGEFTASAFGVESKNWQLRVLRTDERAALLQGPAELRARQETAFAELEALVQSLKDPRLLALAQQFLTDFGPRFQRAGAARNIHHARRGGLVEHTAQMMRTANAICAVYPQLNRDLLVTGALFHDSGKLWENQYAEDGFAMPFDELGELLGHITIGIELVNRLWRGLPLEQWSGLAPRSEDVRQHLLHLIASHHGELQFGSPVPPKTPEAMALHYLDNLDAKLEMLVNAYAASPQLAPRIQEKVWPLPGNLVQPLADFS